MAEAAARLLGEVPLPNGAVEVSEIPGFGPANADLGANPDGVDESRFWDVPGEPSTVIASVEEALEHHPPARIGSYEHGVLSGPGGTEEWSASFSFAVKEPAVAESEELALAAIAAKGGGTALRASALVIPAGAPPGPH